LINLAGVPNGTFYGRCVTVEVSFSPQIADIALLQQLTRLTASCRQYGLVKRT
jgi:hypothetical protein